MWSVAALPCPQTAVGKVEQRLDLLDGPVLEELTRKVRTLEREMDKVIPKKQTYLELTGSKNSEAINVIYDTMQRCDAVAPQVPVVLNRLVSLKMLHDDAAALRASVTTAQSAEAKIDALLRDSTALLQDVEAGFAENVAIIERNMAQMDERMAEVTAKFQSLEVGTS